MLATASARALSLCTLPILGFSYALAHSLVIARHSRIRIYCARRVLHHFIWHPFRTCRTLPPLGPSRPSFSEGDTQAVCVPAESECTHGAMSLVDYSDSDVEDENEDDDDEESGEGGAKHF